MTTPAQIEELKGCPCCKGKAQLWHCQRPNSDHPDCIDHQVECDVCGLQTPLCDTEIDAVSVWNTRQPDEALAQKAERASIFANDCQIEMVDALVKVRDMEKVLLAAQQKAALLDETVTLLARIQTGVGLEGVRERTKLSEDIHSVINRSAALPSTPPAIGDRDEVIEECAKKIDWYRKHHAETAIDWKTGGTSGDAFLGDMAASIRRLKSSPLHKDKA